MSWLAKLKQTYEENDDQYVGKFERNRFDSEYTLIPVAHTTQSAHIEIVLDAKGELQLASIVDKADATTIIPCTEDSASRTSSPVPYPLFDKLMYVAGDYAEYVDGAKENTYALYMEQLRGWCESPQAHSKVNSVYAYLQKGCLIGDLVKREILWLGEDGKLLTKWNKDAEAQYGEKKRIFQVLAGDQQAAFVRFLVEIPGDPEPRLWRDRSVQEAFIQYSERQQVEKDLCYITGEWLPCVDKHASRIRSSGDKAKLISSNDSAGFTYRGRFSTSREAAAISFVASQKAHNALKWLIERQGINMGGRVFVLWGTDQVDAPPLHVSSQELVSTVKGEDEDDDLFTLSEEEGTGDKTHQAFARQLGKALNGYRYDGTYEAEVILLVLDAATLGRMAVVYYRDMNKELFLKQLEKWHTSCAWLHPYYDKEQKKNRTFYGAPATRDIANATYGFKADDKIVKGFLERMLPSIVDGREIPRDIVRSLINRASNPVGMEGWEWERTLSVACAVIRKEHEKEGYQLGLDTTNEDRSYLFGRMLAIADVLERSALSREDGRATNAIRYMSAFSRHPARTWNIIQTALQPYQARMGARAIYHSRLLDEVGSMLKPEEYTDSPLTGKYLLGFYSQRHALYQKKAKETGKPEDTLDSTTEEEEN
ncbi:type I-C CRISPR-associated protein Cas8c/Csd1 [Gorillibacterium sp. CAU 1737]|uniref:type I-C CRISPR-associated protein Cas8c/Csd1 n=1 Tax=Gorillibacterium sp. CAU 1737 TaxID=3140362 RepID=UPI0032605157